MDTSSIYRPFRLNAEETLRFVDSLETNLKKASENRKYIESRKPNYIELKTEEEINNFLKEAKEVRNTEQCTDLSSTPPSL